MRLAEPFEVQTSRALPHGWTVMVSRSPSSDRSHYVFYTPQGVFGVTIDPWDTERDFVRIVADGYEAMLATIERTEHEPAWEAARDGAMDNGYAVSW